MALTVIQHVLARLRDIGITDVFGVPGDFAFPVNDAICNHPDMNWIGCANELNAAYAADGYARVKGVGALSTTYGVGELSALAGVAGAYAEYLPIFHLVGTPRMAVQRSRALVHHTLGTGEYDLFRRMAEPVVVGHAGDDAAKRRLRDRAADRRGVLSPPAGLYGVPGRPREPAGW
jgi:indolepyruvate decarboxylase